MGRKQINEKKEAGRQRKTANSKLKTEANEREREEAEAAEWKKGSNIRGATRSEAAANRADEAARKRQEKAALQALEEEDNGPGGKGKAKIVSKKKKKSKNDFSLLEEALVGDAEKNLKAVKKAERVKKEREERLRLERQKQKDVESRSRNPLLKNTDDMLANAIGDDEGVGHLNAPPGEAQGSTGIDAALSALSVGEGKSEKHPEKRMKALHMAFIQRMMPEMKNDYPGLKMSQYKEKIYQLWKKNPENPMNWPKAQ